MSRPLMMMGVLLLAFLLVMSCRQDERPPWEEANPIASLPEPPLGVGASFADLAEPPTPERVRLGRWLFYDKRLSADGTLACASCHQPEHGFSEPTPVSTGIRDQKGGRKAPPVLNLAWTVYPHFFWDGRAGSLEEQALGPIANPIEMGNTHEAMIATLRRIEGYRPYFEEAFGDPEITKERVAKAIADYERTRMSGDSSWDRWKHGGGESAVSEEVKRGDALFFDRAGCNTCHFGPRFTDDRFHNLGIGWNPATGEFADEGRFLVTGDSTDLGAFKTPTLREVTKRAPYMHNGSLATLREVVEHYSKGGSPNPWLSPRIDPLGLTDEEIDALLALMEALEGEGYQDDPPAAFPE